MSFEYPSTCLFDIDHQLFESLRCWHLLYILCVVSEVLLKFLLLCLCLLSRHWCWWFDLTVVLMMPYGCFVDGLGGLIAWLCIIVVLQLAFRNVTRELSVADNSLLEPLDLLLQRLVFEVLAGFLQSEFAHFVINHGHDVFDASYERVFAQTYVSTGWKHSLHTLNARCRLDIQEPWLPFRCSHLYRRTRLLLLNHYSNALLKLLNLFVFLYDFEQELFNLPLVAVVAQLMVTLDRGGALHIVKKRLLVSSKFIDVKVMIQSLLRRTLWEVDLDLIKSHFLQIRARWPIKLW